MAWNVKSGNCPDVATKPEEEKKEMEHSKWHVNV